MNKTININGEKRKVSFHIIVDGDHYNVRAVDVNYDYEEFDIDVVFVIDGREFKGTCLHRYRKSRNAYIKYASVIEYRFNGKIFPDNHTAIIKYLLSL